LPDAGRKARIGHDRLPERSIRRRQDDGENQDLGPVKRTEHCDPERPARQDCQRQTDAEQPRGHGVLASKRGQVDTRSVGEEDERQRQLGKDSNLLAGRTETDPAKPFAP
jgi:hypothetical protein